MEYYENHQAEYEEMAAAEEEMMRDSMAVDEFIPEADPDSECEVPVEQQNWGLLYHLRDTISTFNDEQFSLLSQLLKDTRKVNTPKARLYAEAEELGNKIEALDKFLRMRDMKTGERNVVLKGITDAQLFLMQKQLELEKELYNILVARYSVFDVRVDDRENGTVKIVEE